MLVFVVNSRTGKMNISLSRPRLRFWSRETVSAVPSCASLLILHILRLNLVLTCYGIPPDFRGGVHLFIYNRQTPSGQSRVYRVTQLRIDDGVDSRESAGTVPVNLKVVPNGFCLALVGHHVFTLKGPTNIMRLSFPHSLLILFESTICMYGHTNI